MFPITRLTLERHDSNDPNAVGIIGIKHCKRKIIRKVTPDVADDAAKAPGHCTDFADQSLDFVVKTSAQFGPDSRVMSGSLGIFLVSLGMKPMRIHRPTIWRIRADTTSPGIPCT